jgi:hypothetical protein
MENTPLAGFDRQKKIPYTKAHKNLNNREVIGNQKNKHL